MPGGRDAWWAVCLPSSGGDEKDNIRVADPWISHSHCALFQQDNALVVRDLDSKNGIFLHGVRIREAQVLPGDCITLGRTEITVRYRLGAGEDPANGDDSTVSEKAASRAPFPGGRRPISSGPTTEQLLY